MASPNSKTNASNLVLKSAVAALRAAGTERMQPEAADAIAELGDLVALRALVAERLARARRSADVIATTVLNDQLEACLRDVDQRLSDATNRLEQLFARSA